MNKRSRQAVRDLSIRQVFLLLAVLNGIVLLALLISSWRLLLEPSYSSYHAYTTIFLSFLLVVGVGISYRIVTLRVILPLNRLVRESQSMVRDDLDIGDRLRVSGSDEIARLAAAFNDVLQLRSNAIFSLDRVNQRLTTVNRQVEDSIRYAALLQRSILPDQQLSRRFGSDYFVLWSPRDTVGGDCYVFHDEGTRCLAGVVDCAGHGVPGAMMTMLARAGLDRYIQQIGIDSPAALLRATNAGMSDVLSQALISRALATSMDVGLVSLDVESRTLLFAGARISLYWSDGHNVGVLKGERRSLWDRRRGEYCDHRIPLLPGATYYMATDGLFDQSGPPLGFGLGRDQFCEWLQLHAAKPMPDQLAEFDRAIADYRGEYPQRDDITLLAFRVH